MNSGEDIAQLIGGVLDIIEYPLDKKKFIDDFLALAVQETVVVLIKTLSQEDQDNLKIELAQDIAPENMQRVVDAYVGHNKYVSTLQEIAQELFNEFVKTAAKDIPKEKKKRLHDYLTSFSSNN